MSEDERIQYKFMIPAGLKSRLEDAAHDKRRSLSAEIIARLEDSFANSEPQRAMDADLFQELFGNVREIRQAINDLAKQSPTKTDKNPA